MSCVSNWGFQLNAWFDLPHSQYKNTCKFAALHLVLLHHLEAWSGWWTWGRLLLHHLEAWSRWWSEESCYSITLGLGVGGPRKTCYSITLSYGVDGGPEEDLLFHHFKSWSGWAKEDLLLHHWVMEWIVDTRKTVTPALTSMKHIKFCEDYKVRYQSIICTILWYL